MNAQIVRAHARVYLSRSPMPGTPKWNAARDLLDMLGEDFVLEQIAEGIALGEVARSCGPCVSRRMLTRWIYAEAERREHYREARHAAAALLAEEAKTISDTVREERDAIAKARERIGTRKWLAGVLDREFAPGPKSTTVELHQHQHVNIQELHLDALRAKGGPAALNTALRERAVLPAPEIVVEASEVEVESEEEEESDASPSGEA